MKLIAFISILALISGCQYTPVVIHSAGNNVSDAKAGIEKQIEESKASGCKVEGFSSAESLQLVSDCPECEDLLNKSFTYSVLLKCPNTE